MCNMLLRDPFNNLWQMGVQDDGTPTLDLTAINSPLPQGPILQGLATIQISSGYGVGGYGVGGFGGSTATASVNNWHLAVDSFGAITTDLVSAPTPPQIALPSFVLTSPSGFNWIVTSDSSGTLLTDPGSPTTGGNFPDIIPTQNDITLSRWPLSTGIFCSTCGNAAVTVQADLSCWCCACNSFVPPEDTNMIVVLEE